MNLNIYLFLTSRKVRVNSEKQFFIDENQEINYSSDMSIQFADQLSEIFFGANVALSDHKAGIIASFEIDIPSEAHYRTMFGINKGLDCAEISAVISAGRGEADSFSLIIRGSVAEALQKFKLPKNRALVRNFLKRSDFDAAIDEQGLRFATFCNRVGLNPLDLAEPLDKTP